MKRDTVLFAVLALVAAAEIGCGTGSGGGGKGGERVARKRQAATKQTNFEASRGAKEMGVQNEVGVYDAHDVDETLAEHMGDVRACYARAGKAQRYAGGKVNLRFLVGGDGTPTDVLVLSSDLGNYEVERCLVEVARQIKFPPPLGRKATTFEYPVEFRSTGQMAVQDLDDSLKLERDVATYLPTLADCGPVAETGASAILYVEPRGVVASVGLAADAPLDEAAGSCVVKEIRRRWRMSATLPGRMVRCRVNIPAVIAARETASSRPASLSASLRRRGR